MCRLFHYKNGFSVPLSDYVMLDINGDSDDLKSSLSPPPLSSSPDSVSSELEALLHSKRVCENGSPDIKPKRIVVSKKPGHRSRSSGDDVAIGGSSDKVEFESSMKKGRFTLSSLFLCIAFFFLFFLSFLFLFFFFFVF